MSAPSASTAQPTSSRGSGGTLTPRTLPVPFEASVERFAPNVLIREKREGTWQDTTYAELRGLPRPHRRRGERG